MLIKCNQCQNSFEKSNSAINRSKSGKHYCSRSCATTMNNRGRQRNPPKQRSCNRCSKTYSIKTSSHRSKKICKDCALKREEYLGSIRKESIGSFQLNASIQNKHPSWKNSYVRNFARSWNKELKSHPCQNCGYSKHIEFCHIKAITSFPDSALLGEINSPENILILCRNCHWELDNDQLNAVDIPKRTSPTSSSSNNESHN